MAKQFKQERDGWTDGYMYCQTRDTFTHCCLNNQIPSYVNHSSGVLSLRYVLIDSDRVAFIFNGAPFPALNINPIDTNICMRHLQHNI